MSKLIELLVFAFILLLLSFFEYLDMWGRLEIIEKKHAQIWKWINLRPVRLLLLLLAILLLAKEIKDTTDVPEVPPIKVAAPIIQMTSSEVIRATEREPKNSLRRRTMQLANDMEKYFLERGNSPSRPPFAAPNSNDPNPSDEQKKAIERYRKYEQDTLDYYFAHYRDRMIGIIKEYEAKGVKVGYLESGARQRPQYL